MSKNKNSEYKSAFFYLYKHIRPHKKWYLGATIIALALVVTGIFNARVTQMLVDSSINEERITIVFALVLFTLIIVLNILLNYFKDFCTSNLAARASMDIKQNISKSLLNAKYSELVKQKSGDLLTSVNIDTNMVCDFIAGDLIGLFSQFAMAIGTLVYLLYINPILAIVTFLYTPLGMFFTLSLNNKMNKLYPINADYKGDALSVFEQALVQIPIIKSYMTERKITSKIYDQYNKVYKNEIKISVWNSLLQSACSSTSYIPRITFMIVAGLMVINGEMTVGTFIAVFDLLSYIISPSVYFPFILNGFNRSIASMNRIKKIENIPQTHTPSINEFNRIPSIDINKVSFEYEKGKPIFEKLSINHKGSGIIVVSGTSGVGKTTLLDLIAGLYQPRKGSIIVNGDISVVSQDTYIFNGTLKDNVRLAKPDATDYEIEMALRGAGAVEFAEDLPNGYETLLGDGNNNLSGGQMQRLSLARTILSDKPIWLLDEPTSALDTRTEQIIIDVISKMSKEKLIVISAHRQSLIDLADKVICIKGGNNYEVV